MVIQSCTAVAIVAATNASKRKGKPSSRAAAASSATGIANHKMPKRTRKPEVRGILVRLARGGAEPA